MKYLNKNKDRLFSGEKVKFNGKVYWANMTTMEVYAHSVDEEILGSISGYKVADISLDFDIVCVDGMKMHKNCIRTYGMCGIC